MTRQHVIVIADDDPLMNLVFRETLSHAGYAVLCCFSGTEAERVITGVVPDVAIIDMHMEARHAGLHLIEALRRNPATARLSTIVCSADLAALDSFRPRLDAWGATVLPKPIALDHLLDTVRKLLPLELEVGG